MKYLIPVFFLGCVACNGDKDEEHTGENHTGMQHTGEDDTGTSYETEGLTEGGTFWVAYTTDPAPIVQSETFSATFTIFDGADNAVQVTDATLSSVDASMPDHGHGMNVVPEITDNGDGTFTASPLNFHMSGYWTIPAEITQDTTVEAITFELNCCGN
jgi:hypothetical protein